MKRLVLTAALLLGPTGALPLAAGNPELAQRTFWVSGLECGTCVYMAHQSMTETKGVAEVEIAQMLESAARVTFDPKVVSEHQIAQAVRDSIPVHGTPYLATLKLRIPAYSQAGQAARVNALFARWKKWIEVEILDEREGQLAIRFRPLDKDPKTQGPRGWSLALLEQTLKAPAPAGLGLDYRIVREGDPP